MISEEVTISLAKYDGMQDEIAEKNAKIKELESKISELKNEHDDELEKMAKEGKVRYVSTKRDPLFPLIVSEEKEYKGFEDVKQEVYDSFKKGLFDFELDEQKAKQLGKYIDKLAQTETKVDELKRKVYRLEHRSLWKRILNK